jgi:alginate O-acetyltransferase complex protein AlgI
VFFAIVVALHALPFGWTTRKVNLLIASYIFYAAWNPPFILLLWISTVVDWYAAQGLVRAQRPSARRAWMLLSVVANLGMLLYFKYGTFLLNNFTTLMASVGVDYHARHADVVLPVGISFYPFATMSYTLDVYPRRALPARNFLDYALFVTFFPDLVAGPIMRPTELVPQFETPRRACLQQLCDYLAYEDRVFPRKSTWDLLLEKTRAPGIHFQDYRALQGFDLPEWLHMTRASAKRYTEALYRILERDYAPPDGTRW